MGFSAESNTTTVVKIQSRQYKSDEVDRREGRVFHWN